MIPEFDTDCLIGDEFEHVLRLLNEHTTNAAMFMSSRSMRPPSMTHQEIAYQISAVIGHDFEFEFNHHHVAVMFEMFPYVGFAYYAYGVGSARARDIFLEQLAVFSCNCEYSPHEKLHRLMRTQLRRLFGATNAVYGRMVGRGPIPQPQIPKDPNDVCPECKLAGRSMLCENAYHIRFTAVRLSELNPVGLCPACGQHGNSHVCHNNYHLQFK